MVLLGTALGTAALGGKKLKVKGWGRHSYFMPHYILEL